MFGAPVPNNDSDRQARHTRFFSSEKKNPRMTSAVLSSKQVLVSTAGVLGESEETIGRADSAAGTGTEAAKTGSCATDSEGPTKKSAKVSTVTSKGYNNKSESHASSNRDRREKVDLDARLRKQ